MNKLKILFVAFIIVSGKLYSQNNFESLTQEYTLQNPAYFVEDNSYHFSLFRKQQWKNFNVANSLLIQKAFSQERMNLGLLVESNRYSFVLLENSIKIPVSYQISALKGKLSGGLQLGVKQQRLESSQLTSFQSGDSFFESKAVWATSLSVGLFYRNDQLEAGVSFLSPLGVTNEINTVQRLSLLLGRQFVMSKKLNYQPVFFFKNVINSYSELVLKNEFEFNEMATLAVLLNDKKQVVFATSLNLKKLIPRFTQEIRISYSYKQQFSDVDLLGVTHEFGLNYVWNKLPSIEKIKKTSVIQSPVSFD